MIAEKIHFYINDEALYATFNSFVEEKHCNLTFLKNDNYLNIEILDGIPDNLFQACREGRRIVFRLTDDVIIGGIIDSSTVEIGPTGTGYQNLKITIKVKDDPSF